MFGSLKFNRYVHRVWQFTAESGLPGELLPKPDLLVMLGNHRLDTLQAGRDYYAALNDPEIPVLVSGGAGLGTELLRRRIRVDAQMASEDYENKSEAEIMSALFTKLANGSKPRKLICEGESENTPQNFTRSLALVEQLGLHPGATVMVLQCPTQRFRAAITGRKAWACLDLHLSLFRPDDEQPPHRLPTAHAVAEVLRLVGYGDPGTIPEESFVAGEVELIDRYYPESSWDVSDAVRNAYWAAKAEFTRLVDANSQLRASIPDDLLPPQKEK